VTADPFFDTRRDRLVTLAARHAVPTMYHFREYAAAGGLLIYGPSIPDLFRRAATYVDKILKGANPGDLPVEQPTSTRGAGKDGPGSPRRKAHFCDGRQIVEATGSLAADD
jgi:ABC-type uncharacterized transport system substrate-binding protein